MTQLRADGVVAAHPRIHAERGGAIPTSALHLQVERIPHHLAKPWILDRHYAHRLPPISEAAGLFINRQLEGVCTFGPPPRMFNDGANLFRDVVVSTYELNRLVTMDGLPRNALSRFVTHACRLLDPPAAIISYADPNAGHHGYIYQATNWFYLGETAGRAKYVNTATGKDFHARSIVSMLGSESHATLPEWIDIDEQLGKHRYLKLVGTRQQRAELRDALIYPLAPYPKGDNQPYEPGYVASQGVLAL